MENLLLQDNESLSFSIDANIIFENKKLLSPCVESFKLIILSSKDFTEIQSNLIKNCQEGNIENLLLRPITWKILLNILECNKTTTIKTWIEKTKKDRIDYLKKKYDKNEKKQYKKFEGDPLSINNNNNNNWDLYFNDNKLKEIIQKDVNRTFQNNTLFRIDYIKKILLDILFIWSKENINLSYRQGMSDILGMILLCFFPYYFSTNNNNDNLNNINDEMIFEPLKYSKSFYLFFHNEKYFECDLFIIFDSIMKEGLINFYKFNNNILDYKKFELFDQIYTDYNYVNLKDDFFYLKCNKIIKEYLKIYDFQLYDFLNKKEIDCVIFLEKWLKCLLCREFSNNETFIFWDAIFAENYIKGNKNFDFLDFICVSMIENIKNNIIDENKECCYSLFFNYPKINSAVDLLKLAYKIRSNIDTKIFEEKNKFLHESDNKNNDYSLNINSAEMINQSNYQKNNNKYLDFFGVEEKEREILETDFQKNFSDETQFSQEQKIINKLNEINNKYKSNFNPNDKLDFNFIIETLKKKFKK